MTALKKHRPKSRFLNSVGCAHPSSVLTSMSMYERPMLALRPFGGSCVSLSEFCRMVEGNSGVGIVVSHILKSSAMPDASRSCSSSRSSVGSHETARWQFCRHTQYPLPCPSAISRSAIGPWPWPSETILRLSPTE